MGEEMTPVEAELVERTPLKAIPAGVRPRCRALALDLRALFEVLQVSVRTYALRVQLDAGALSRYLNGTRVAPAEFVERLLLDVATKAGPRTAEAIASIRAAQRAALAESNRVQAELQRLRDELAEADRRRQRCEVREEAIIEALQARQRDLADLNGRHRELQAASEQERVDHDAELGVANDERARLREECDRLMAKVEALREALDDAHRRTLEAEHRCEELERILEVTEHGATRANAEGGPLQDPDHLWNALWMSLFQLYQAAGHPSLQELADESRSSSPSITLPLGVMHDWLQGVSIPAADQRFARFRSLLYRRAVLSGNEGDLLMPHDPVWEETLQAVEDAIRAAEIRRRLAQA
ncbi:chromosome partition protein Smc [Embleya hyalina]|uniref:Chromosome partition protein Smc n=2 Tax=Embleya hyalina TaxID=516124 RepID=A0A401YYG6_9ACTN|nr:chromosome partition protein Smc [Embleya hyalina]